MLSKTANICWFKLLKMWRFASFSMFHITVNWVSFGLDCWSDIVMGIFLLYILLWIKKLLDSLQKKRVYNQLRECNIIQWYKKIFVQLIQYTMLKNTILLDHIKRQHFWWSLSCSLAGLSKSHCGESEADLMIRHMSLWVLCFRAKQLVCHNTTDYLSILLLSASTRGPSKTSFRYAHICCCKGWDIYKSKSSDYHRISQSRRTWWITSPKVSLRWSDCCSSQCF